MIIDYGTTRRVSLPGGGLRTRRVGKLAYMAPEVFAAGSDEVQLQDARAADVWCCGTTLYALLCGEKAYNDPTTDQAARTMQRTDGRHRLPSAVRKLSDNARKLLECMLHPDPAQRPTATQVLQHPWLADVYAERRARVFPGTDYGAFMEWLNAATAEAQEAGREYFSEGMVASAPGAWGERWRAQWAEKIARGGGHAAGPGGDGGGDSAAAASGGAAS